MTVISEAPPSGDISPDEAPRPPFDRTVLGMLAVDNISSLAKDKDKDKDDDQFDPSKRSELQSGWGWNKDTYYD